VVVRWLRYLICLFLVLVGTAQALPVGAAGTGFVVTPAFQDVDIRADQPRVEYSLQLANQTPHDQNFRLSAIDFGSLDEQGGVAFLGQPANELDHRYGLASWMILENDTVFVPAGGSQEITVTIDNRASLAPGGHYGALLATAVTDTGQPITVPQVGIKEVLSSLVLATKEGGLEENLKMVSQSANGNASTLPSTIEHRFQNTGNVQLVPRGVVEVIDPLGRAVERGVIDEDSGEILPESFRRYKTSLIPLATAWLPGRYRIVSNYRYDGTDTLKTLTTTTWYAGLVIVWIVGLIALTAIIGLGWWLRRRYSLRPTG
jgi:hypothetical protein